MSKDSIEKMVCIMDKNGYEQEFDSCVFTDLSKGKRIAFMNWFQVYDFIKKNFAN